MLLTWALTSTHYCHNDFIIALWCKLEDGQRRRVQQPSSIKLKVSDLSSTVWGSPKLLHFILNVPTAVPTWRRRRKTEAINKVQRIHHLEIMNVWSALRDLNVGAVRRPCTLAFFPLSPTPPGLISSICVYRYSLTCHDKTTQSTKKQASHNINTSC